MYVCCIYIGISSYTYIYLCDQGTCGSHCAPCSVCFLATMVLARPPSPQALAWSMSISLSQVFWQYMNEYDEFVNMPVEYSSKYEEQLRAGNLSFEYDVPYARGTKVYHYEVNLTNMTQCNTRTRTVRNLRRLVVCNA